MVLLTPLLVSAVFAASAALSLPEDDGRGACWGRGCSLHCLWSQRLCRLCCPRPGSPLTTEDPEDSEEPPGEDGGEVTFPDSLPEGTEDAMLETAAHILAIVSAEDAERVRIWLENPERNLDNLDSLASKLAAIPRAPFGRAYWRVVLRAARDRPFTLLRDALAIRAVHQTTVTSNPSPTEEGEAEQAETEEALWQRLYTANPNV